MKYRAYGIVVECDRELPELESAEETAEAAMSVRLSAGSAGVVPGSWFFAHDGTRIGQTNEGFFYDFHRGAAQFALDAGASRIELVRRDEGVSDELVRHFLLDHVMPRAFNLRGDEVVHATSVLTPHGVCAFVGKSGLGKSTLAASFAAVGCPIVTDDCLILRRAAGHVVAIPGYPGVRLLEDAVRALVLDASPVTKIAEDYDKHRARVASVAFASGAAHPLARIYILHRLEAGRAPELSPLNAREAFMGIVGDNTLRFNPRDRAALLREMDFFSHVVSVVPVAACGVPEGLDTLAQTRAAILADARTARVARDATLSSDVVGRSAIRPRT